MNTANEESTSRIEPFKTLDDGIEFISQNYGSNVGEWMRNRYNESTLSLDDILTEYLDQRLRQQVAPFRARFTS
jgi:hypothetical protein